MKLKKIYLFIFAAFVLFSSVATAANKNVYRKNNIQLEYVSYNGGVLFYYVDDKGKKTPVLDTVDFGNSSFIGVLVDKNYFNVKNSGGVTYSCEKTDDGLTVTYTILKKIVLKVAYTISNKNVLNINYTLKNNSTNDHTISVKSIYDTCLGEWNGTSFSTEVKQNIKSEYIISDFQKHKTLTSTDGITGIRFMMDKDFGKYAYKTVVAAKPFFETDEFDGHFIEGRGFNTVLSYNNSCVGFFFKSRFLKSGKEAYFNQRIEFAQAVITSFQKVEDEEDEAKKYQDDEDEPAEETVKPQTETNIAEETVVETEPVSTEAVEEKIAESNPQASVEPEKTAPVFENIQSETENSSAVKVNKEIDKRKARDLIERIKSLEDSGKNTDRSEIIQLQRELDDLLDQLKK